MEEHIYILSGGEKRGPYVLQQINAMWLSGQLTADALYWFDGMEDWKPLADFMDADSGTEPVEEPELPGEVFIEHTGIGRIVTNFPPARLYDLAYGVLEGYGVSVSDSVEGSIILGQTAMNWSTFGQTVRLDIDYHPRGSAVSVSSTSSQLYDWGRGKKDQEEIIRRLVAAIESDSQ